jgi:hypothetical protein
LKHCSFSSILDSFDLFCRLFDGLAADGAFRILKELQLAAALAFAPYQKRSPASVAALAAYESRAAAIGASGGQRSAAATTYGIAALNGFQAGRAMVTEGRAAAAFGAVVGVPLYHLPAMDAGDFVSSHGFTLSFGCATGGMVFTHPACLCA